MRTAVADGGRGGGTVELPPLRRWSDLFRSAFSRTCYLAMSIPATPSNPTPAGDERKAAQADEINAALPFEERLRLFWQRNSKAITAALVAVLLVIVAKGGWEYFQAEKEKDIGQAYAAASTSAQLRGFATTHAGHPLAGAAQLRLADEAYADGKFADAAGLYEQAAGALQVPALASRARLGLAMAKVQSDRAAEGESALKAFAADANEEKAFRAEAMYHLASHALANSQAEEVKTYAEQLMQLDPASPWTQRAMMLRASMPEAAATAPDAADADADGPSIRLPGLTK